MLITYVRSLEWHMGVYVKKDQQGQFSIGAPLK